MQLTADLVQSGRRRELVNDVAVLREMASLVHNVVVVKSLESIIQYRNPHLRRKKTHSELGEDRWEPDGLDVILNSDFLVEEAQGLVLPLRLLNRRWRCRPS